MGYYKGKGDVSWCLPDKKRPFAYSTKATSDLIVVLSETNQTTKDVYNAINFDEDAKKILKHYIDNGYGNYLFRDFVTINPSLKYRKIEDGTIKAIDLKDLKKHLDNDIEISDYDYEY